MKGKQANIVFIFAAVFCAVLFAPSAHAADKYWVGGTDSWNGTAGNKWATTSGGNTTTTLPTSADACFFDANSTGTVTVASGNTGCGSVDFTGFTQTLTMSATLTVSGNVTLVSAMTVSGSGTLAVNATSTLTSNGKTWPGGFYLNSTTSNTVYTLADNWTVLGATTLGPYPQSVTLTLNGSTLYADGNLIIGASPGTNTVTIGGTTSIVLGGTGTWQPGSTTQDTTNKTLQNNLTVNTTGTITISGTVYFTGTFTYTTGTVVTTNSSFIYGGTSPISALTGITWNNLKINGSGTAYDTTGIMLNGTLELAGASNSYTIGVGLVLHGALSLTGTTDTTYTLSENLTVPGTATLGPYPQSVTITVNGFTMYVGGGLNIATSPGTNNVIVNGTTNIVLNGTGTWRSGSSAGANETLRNNLTINTTGTITISSGIRYNTGTLTYTTGTVTTTGSTLAVSASTTLNTNGITWNNVTLSGTSSDTLSSNLTVNGTLTVSGATTFVGPGVLVFTASSTLAGSSAMNIPTSFTLASGMTNSYTGTLTFVSTSTTATSTLTSNGVQFLGSLTVNASNTVQLADALNVTSTKTLTLTAGTFDANNQSVTIGAFSSSGSTARTLTMGSGTWTVNGNLDPWTATTATGFTLTPGSSTIKLTGAYTAAKTFAGGGLTYHNFWSALPTNAFPVNFTGSNTFSDFKLNASTTVQFTANTTTTVTTFTATGSAGNLITINSVTTGTHSLVKTGSGAVSADYLSVQHSIATPTRTWFAGSNSTNNQGTATAGSGWYFTPVPPSDTTGVSATITNRNIIISWTAPTTYIGGTSLADLATFSVYRDTDSSGSFTTQVGSQISSSTLSFTDPDPTIGTTLYYEVTSVNASGTESFKSSATTGVLLAESTVSAGGGGGTYAPASFVYESTALASAPAPTQPAPAPEPTPTPTSENLAPLYARISELQAQVALLMSGIASQASSPVPSAPSTGSGQASSQPPSSGTPTGTAGPAASTPSSVPVSSYFFPRTLRIADEGEDVKQLQIYLNTHGFLIAPDGPGSLDNETTIYGALTYDAISRFQEAYANELLVPLGLTKGYGYFGPLTRRYVNGG